MAALNYQIFRFSPQVNWKIRQHLVQGPKDLFIKNRSKHSSELLLCILRFFMNKSLNAIQFLVWSKKFEPAQHILGSVEGQGLRSL